MWKIQRNPRKIYKNVDFSTSMLVYPRAPLVGGILPCWLHDFSNPQNPPGLSTKSKAELDTFFFIKWSHDVKRLKTSIFIWLVVCLPLWKMMEFRQLGWWHSQYMESQKFHVPNHQPVTYIYIYRYIKNGLNMLRSSHVQGQGHARPCWRPARFQTNRRSTMS